LFLQPLFCCGLDISSRPAAENFMQMMFLSQQMGGKYWLPDQENMAHNLRCISSNPHLSACCSFSNVMLSRHIVGQKLMLYSYRELLEKC